MNKITFTGNKLHQYVMYFEAIYGNCVGSNKEVRSRTVREQTDTR